MKTKNDRFTIGQSATISFEFMRKREEEEEEENVSREKKSETDIVKWSRKWI